MAKFEEYKIDFDFGNTPLKNIQKFEVNIIKEYNDGKKENDICNVNNNLYDPRKTCNEITNQPNFNFINGALNITNLDSEVKSLNISYISNLPGDVGTETPIKNYIINSRGNSYTFNVPNYNEYNEYKFKIAYILLNDDICSTIETSLFPPSNNNCVSPSTSQISINPKSNSIDIQWNSFIPNANVKKYLILWGIVGNSSQNIEIADINQKTYTINNLSGNTNYFIRVFSICNLNYNPDDYNNDTSNEKRTKTLLDVCNKPDNTTIKFNNGVISWNAPNPLPEKYKLKVKIFANGNVKNVVYDIIPPEISKSIQSDLSGIQNYSLAIELGSECPSSGIGENYNPPYYICGESGCSNSKPNLNLNLRNNNLVVSYGLINAIIGKDYKLILRDSGGVEINRFNFTANNSNIGCPTNEEYTFTNIDIKKSYSVTLEGECNGLVNILNTANLVYQQCPKGEIATLSSSVISESPANVSINIQNFDKFKQNEIYKIKATQGSNQYIQEFTPLSSPPISNQNIIFDTSIIQNPSNPFNYSASTLFELIDSCGNVITSYNQLASCTDTINLTYNRYDSSGSLGKIELNLLATNSSGTLNGLPYVITYKRGTTDEYIILTDASIRNNQNNLIIIEDKGFTQTGNIIFKVYDKCGSTVNGNTATINGNASPKTEYNYNPCDSFNITQFEFVSTLPNNSIVFLLRANKNLRNSYTTWEINGQTPQQSSRLNQDGLAINGAYQFTSLPSKDKDVIYKFYDSCGNLKQTITVKPVVVCNPQISSNGIQLDVPKDASGNFIQNPSLILRIQGINLLPYNPTEYRIRISQTGLNPNPTIITVNVSQDTFNTANNLAINLNSFGFDTTKNAKFEILDPCSKISTNVLNNGTYNYVGVQNCNTIDLSKANFTVKIEQNNLNISLTGTNIPLGDYKIKLLNNTESLGQFEITINTGSNETLISRPDTIEDNKNYTFELYYICNNIDTRTGKTSESIYNNCLLSNLTIKKLDIDTANGNKLYMDYDLILGNSQNIFTLFYTSGTYNTSRQINNLTNGTNQRYYLDNLYGGGNFFTNTNTYSILVSGRGCRTYNDINLKIYHQCNLDTNTPPLAEYNYNSNVLNNFPPLTYSNVFVSNNNTRVDFTLTLTQPYNSVLAQAADNLSYRVYIVNQRTGGIVNGQNGVEVSYLAFQFNQSIARNSPITVPILSSDKLSICTCRCSDTAGSDPQNICGVLGGEPRTGNNCQNIN